MKKKLIEVVSSFIDFTVMHAMKKFAIEIQFHKSKNWNQYQNW